MTKLYHGSYISVPSPLTGVGRKELHFVGTEPVAEKGGQQ